MNEAEIVALEEELVFLLRSLDDLDRERFAQDVEDTDYEALRSSYVARAAEVQRLLEGSTGSMPAVQSSRRKIAIGMVLVLAIASTAGWFVARESGQRLPGDSLSGGIVMSNANLLARASQLGFSDPEQAIALYTQVLDLDPDNIEALTYRGWIRALSARDMEGEQGVSTLLEAFKDLKRAVEIDPTYPDAHCFLGIVQFRYLSDAEGAKASLDLCIAANPPAQVQGFVDSIVDEVDAALASG